METTASTDHDHWISTRHLQRLMSVARRAGHDIHELLRLAGLTAAQLNDGNGRVPLHAFEQLFDWLETRCQDPFIGLRMAEDITPSAFGPLGFLFQSCGTLAEVLEMMDRFRGLMSSIGRSALVHGPGRFEQQWDCTAGSGLLRRHATEFVLGSSWAVARLLVPDIGAPIAVQFAHAAPAEPRHFKRHFEFFGCPVYFDRPCSSIVMPASALKMAVAHGDAVLKALLERHTQHLLEKQTRPNSLIEDVRRLLTALVLAGDPSRDAVARQLGLSPRTLHRKLEEQGTSYRDQFDMVRLDMARRGLMREDQPIVELAEQLGFSSQQAFTRWFKERGGVTPGQFRADAVAQAAEKDKPPPPT